MNKRRFLTVAICVLTLVALCVGLTACVNIVQPQDPSSNCKITLTFDSSKGNVPSEGNNSYAKGTRVTVTIQPNADFEVDAFTVGGEDKKAELVDNAYAFVIDADVTIVVTFKQAQKMYREEEGKIYFGKYPQTAVEDADLTQQLADLVGALPSKGNRGDWKDYGYYISSVQEEFMWYKDVEYGGEKYRGVYFVSNKPDITSRVSDTRSQQYKYNYFVNTLYWFKFDEIEWLVLEKSGGEAFLVSTMALDARHFFHDRNSRDLDGAAVLANNYKESDIRQWLIQTFYAEAFNSAEQAIIKTSLVDNSAASTDNPDNAYTCENTNDKVFLLSYAEANNPAYFADKAARKRNATAYAMAQGIAPRTWWWLRSPQDDGQGLTNYLMQDVNGKYGNFDCVCVDENNGIVPALRITL